MRKMAALIGDLEKRVQQMRRELDARGSRCSGLSARRPNARFPKCGRCQAAGGAIRGAACTARGGRADPKVTTLDVKPLGPLAAREIRTFSLKTKGPTPQEVTGKYVVVWEKVGSDWMLAADIWNDGK